MRRDSTNKTKFILYSCITGKAVWIYPNMCRESIRKAYYRARKFEKERLSGWPQTMARRKGNILRFLSDLGVSITANLSAERRDAVRKIAQVAEELPACYRDFYEHIKAENKNR